MKNAINKEKLAAGIIFGDPGNEEYVYMPGAEIGSPFPVCIFQQQALTEDVALEEAAEIINRLQLKILDIPPFSKI